MVVSESHRGYDLLAPVYGRLKKLVFGDKLRVASRSFLDTIEEGQSVLIIGGGDGELLEDLANCGKHPNIVYVDASEKMIEKAGRRAPEGLIIEYILAHYQHYNFTKSFDVIITPFFLDLFEGIELERIIDKATRNLKPKGIWLVADFQRTGKLRHLFLEKLMYLFFLKKVRVILSG